MFSIVILCALLLGSIWFYVRSIFSRFGGKIPYFIKKSHNRRFDSPIYPKVYLEMLQGSVNVHSAALLLVPQ